MKCPNCGTEMVNNYVLRLGLSGAIKIEKERNIELQSSLPKIVFGKMKVSQKVSKKLAPQMA